VKLIIQIPCLNEEEQLPSMLATLPRKVDGFDIVEWLVIDDGSTDDTAEVARAHGVDHIVRFPNNRGLAFGFQAGLDACLKLGADVIVNTDADNQYDASYIPALVEPVLTGDAELVIGDRRVQQIDEFSFLKKRLQHLGSWTVRKVSGTDVPDATSGFRAYSREAALQLVVVNRYTYTLESIIQAGKLHGGVTSVPIDTNEATRESRLFSSMWAYVRRNAFVILRVFAQYEPLRFFGFFAAIFFALGLVSFLPFLVDWFRTGDTSGHLQSIILGAILILAAVQIAAVAFLADLITAHRTLSQRLHDRVRRLELTQGVEPSYLVSTVEGGAPADDSAAVDRPEVEREDRIS